MDENSVLLIRTINRCFLHGRNNNNNNSNKLITNGNNTSFVMLNEVKIR